MKRVILHDSTGDVLMLDNVYPVGSIYMSVNSTNPGTLFGGTWSQIKDTFLLACGSTYANGSTGGSATHTLTVDEMPSHHHSLARTTGAGSNTTGTGVPPHNGVWQADMQTNYTGGGNAHNNMPPYLAVYMWQRTA